VYEVLKSSRDDFCRSVLDRHEEPQVRRLGESFPNLEAAIAEKVACMVGFLLGLRFNQEKKDENGEATTL
jgi:hypothetical protein